MQTPASPLFPASQLTLSPSISQGGNAPASGYDSSHPDELLVPQLPDKPLTQTSSIQVYVIPAEKHLFVQGFEPHEYAERPPTLLRGCLYVRVLKPSKIRSITLSFKGHQRTDWPEGIPPKKNTYVEVNDVLSHTWPFYQQENPVPNGGADVYKALPRSNHHHSNNTLSPARDDHDVSHLSLTDTMSRNQSPAVDTDSLSLHHSSGGTGMGNFFTRTLSPSAASHFVKRAASPAPPNPSESSSDLTTVTSATDHDSGKPGHFTVGDYIYNFEHAIHPSIPETTHVTFGAVGYHLEANIVRIGAFKSNLSARMPIEIIRTPAEMNTEENEPIVITRDWEDQLRYDIVVGGKSVVLDSYLPLAFRFVPLWGKVALHRIRVYLTENLEYYCQDKKVHRSEPSRKFLLLEHKAKKGRSLLSKSGGLTEDADPDDLEDILPRELEFQLFVPKILNDKHNHHLHPDTSYENIQAHHWIKMCLRISKLDPENEGKRKHYEISIDSPIHVLSEYAAHGNTVLPAYDTHQPQPFLPMYTPSSPPLSPGVVPLDYNHHMLSQALSNGSAPLSPQPGSQVPLNQSSSIATNTNSLDHIMQAEASPMRSASPREFLHLNSSRNNDEPIERDPDMHLEANLYKPNSDSASDLQLHSSQALPHPGTFSPLVSPVSRPIHVLRHPSYNPPPFSADDPPPQLGEDDAVPPPAYEEEDPALSLSPLRIDESPTASRDTYSSTDTSLSHTPRSQVGNINTTFPDNFHVTPPTPLQENPMTGFFPPGTSHPPDETVSNQRNKGSVSSHDTLITARAPSSHPDTESTSGATSRRPSVTPVPPDDDGEDIADSSYAPIQPPTSPMHLPATGHETARRFSSTSSTSRRSSTSIVSFTARQFEDLPVEQTIPLLNSSSVSLAPGNNSKHGSLSDPSSATRNTSVDHTSNHGFNHNGSENDSDVRSRNASVHSLLQDSTRRPSNMGGWSTLMHHMMDVDLTDEHNVNGNLSKLRNPRIKKHYQGGEDIAMGGSKITTEVVDEDREHEEAQDDISASQLTANADIGDGATTKTTETTDNNNANPTPNTTRDDSDEVPFLGSDGQDPDRVSNGAAGNSNSQGTQGSSRSSTSFESEVMIDDTNNLRNKSDNNGGENAVPGFNFRYVID